MLQSGAVVGNVGNTLVLASGGSAHGVGVLGDQDAAAVDESVGGVALCGLVIPAAGELNVHGDGGADRLGAQVEGGVARDNLGVGEGADVAHLGLLGGDLTGLDHSVELHTCGNAGQVTAFVDGSECVVEVGELLGVSHGAGSVAELNLGLLLGSLQDVGLMAEAVGENDVATLVNEVQSRIVAGVGLGDVALDDDLIITETESLLGFLDTVDEVEVVGGVLIVEADHTQLEFVIGAGLVARAEQNDTGQEHSSDERERQELLHFFSPCFCLLGNYVKPFGPTSCGR